VVAGFEQVEQVPLETGVRRWPPPDGRFAGRLGVGLGMPASVASRPVDDTRPYFVVMGGSAAAVVERVLSLFEAGARIVAFTPYLETVELHPLGGAVLLRSEDLQIYLEEGQPGGRECRLARADLEAMARRFGLELTTIDDAALVFELRVPAASDVAAGVDAVARARDELWALASNGEPIAPGPDEPLPAPPASGAPIGRLLARLDVLTGARCDVNVDAGLCYPMVIDRDPETGIAQATDNFRCLEGLEGDVLEDSNREDFEAARAQVDRFADAFAPQIVGGPVELYYDETARSAMFRVLLGADDEPMDGIHAVAAVCRAAAVAFPAWRAAQRTEPR
jgi:hypothetical protein